MLRRYADESSFPVRAAQAWVILIARARNRQTVTYGLLAELMNYGSPQIGGLLEYILRYCDVNELPPLTVLVVNKDTGIPGSGMSEYSFSEQEAVFRFDWYSIFPPTPEELIATYQQ